MGAADLLPFLEVFGGSYSATPLYCQDTASFTAHFVFDPSGPTFQDVTIEPPLVGTVFCTCENPSGYHDPILLLPTDSVPNGYRVTVVNACGITVTVDPMNDDTNDGDAYKGTNVQYLFFEGVWYPFYVSG